MNIDNSITNNKTKFSLCIPTIDRYDKFLSIYLPKYMNNLFIDEIIISDENGNDVKKIKQNIKNLDKFKFNINDEKLGVFYNKLKCCQLAKNDTTIKRHLHYAGRRMLLLPIKSNKMYQI